MIWRIVLWVVAAVLVWCGAAWLAYPWFVRWLGKDWQGKGREPWTDGTSTGGSKDNDTTE